MRKITNTVVGVVGAISYIAGYLIGMLNLTFLAFFGGFILAGVIIIAFVVLDKIRAEILTNENTLLGKPLTIKTENGYQLHPEDIHEAIEKLGYYEHEMEGK